VANGEWRAINQIMERPDGRNMEETWNNSENSLGIYTRDCAKRKIVGKLKRQAEQAACQSLLGSGSRKCRPVLSHVRVIHFTDADLRGKKKTRDMC
jgi:hypothetical protein